jgi:hypothetical protein
MEEKPTEPKPEEKGLQCIGFPRDCKSCELNQANAQNPDSPPCGW